MREIDRFSQYHPGINFLFFGGAFLGGMFFMHPAYLLCSVISAAAYYLTIRGTEGIRYLAGMLPLFVALTVINPLFNTYGETVLFRYFGGRPYTKEAFFYGMALAAMVITVFLWFASYNVVMTSDKFIYLFGSLLPSVSLLFIMILRLIPGYQKIIRQIQEARSSVGLGINTVTRGEKIHQGMVLLSTMMTWALEGGVVMADSMKSRGYGCCARRTSFSLYRFEKKDRILLVFMAGLMIVTIWCGICGGADIVYTPVFSGIHMRSVYTATGLIAYAIFLLIPTGINITEDIIWHVLRSKI